MMRSIAALMCFLCALSLVGCDKPTSQDASNVSQFNANHKDFFKEAARLMDQKRFVEAIHELKRRLPEAHPGNEKSFVFHTIGNCYTEMKQFDRALKYYDHSLEEHPGNYITYNDMGTTYCWMGNFVKGKECYLKALDLDPNYPPIQAGLANISQFERDYDKAIVHMKRFIELDDSQP